MPPSTPNQDYSFIMKSSGPAKKPGLNLNSRAVLYVAGVVLVLLVVVLIYAGRSKPQAEMVNVAARATEIARVSDLIAQTSADQDTKNLAATVSLSMNSEKTEITSYLADSKSKVATSTLTKDKNSAIDSQLAAATQPSSLSSTYDSYLKTNLATYLSEISTATGKTGPKGRAILLNATSSTHALLSSPALK